MVSDEHRGRFVCPAEGNGAVAEGCCAVMNSRFLKERAEVLGLHDVPPDLADYIHAAASLFEAERRRLARMMPDRRLETAPSILLQNAALSLAYSRLAYSEGRADAGARFARDSKENILEAHRLAKIESLARMTSAKDRYEDDDEDLQLSEAEYKQLLAAAGSK